MKRGLIILSTNLLTKWESRHVVIVLWLIVVKDTGFSIQTKNDFSEFESCNPLSESVSVGVSIEEKEMRVIAGALALALTLTLFLYPERTKVAT